MKEPKDDKNNNFFNQNPLLTFAIFSVVIILVFKALIGNENSALGGSASQASNKHQEVTYSEL
ncbi:MAG TPA: hypothetical protein EYO73_05450, partial [Sulfurimonas sp.]|nr:hypothetical protein [Sulfurimonas sp.]